MIIPVPEVSPLRLAERLMEIGRKEKLNLDFGDLVKIAERSACDVRSCVGAIQYMGNTDLKDNLSLGLKDTRKNLFDSWKSILAIPIDKSGVVPVSERIGNILRVVQNGNCNKNLCRPSYVTRNNLGSYVDYIVANFNVKITQAQTISSVRRNGEVGARNISQLPRCLRPKTR